MIVHELSSLGGGLRSPSALVSNKTPIKKDFQSKCNKKVFSLSSHG